MTEFSKMGLTGAILQSLSALGFATPTPIQAQAIPHGLAGRDIMGLAQTGTGKTAAFGLPIIDHLLRAPALAGPREARALVLAPTRELASQIALNLKAFSKRSPLKVATVYGGASINVQVKTLARGADILVATPGRLIDLIERKAVDFRALTHLVLDEADQMLDLGFIRDLRRIAKVVPAKRQTMLFSATMPNSIAELARDFLKDPVRVEASPPGKPADRIEQIVYMAEKAEKPRLLKALLKDAPDALSLVFARTKHGADRLHKELERAGFASAAIHGNKSQGQRERALAAFRAGETRVLVATDVAARGIDIAGVTHVYNYDLPNVPEAYVHRIGRTARAGAEGRAVAFYAADEANLLRDVERLLKLQLPRGDARPLVASQPARAAADAVADAEAAQREARCGSNGRPGGSRNGAGGNRPKHGGKPHGREGDAAQGEERDASHGPSRRRRAKPFGAAPSGKGATAQAKAGGEGFRNRRDDNAVAADRPARGHAGPASRDEAPRKDGAPRKRGRYNRPKRAKRAA
ncbi:MAG TPA: DEAD/DEAH box helicase [Rhizobiaceae bacterium]|nr:DEAD/DEAH box helicase [Rhizobiaceae bacterium]